MIRIENSKKIVSEFLSKYSNKFNRDMENAEPYTTLVRLASLTHQLSKIQTYFETVTVVSGSEDEPDLRIINFDNLHILNYEKNSIDTRVDQNEPKIFKNKIDKTFSNKRFDIDKSWKDLEVPRSDLVICNQVFEHIYNPHQAIQNLKKVAKKGGYILVSIPSINCIHSEPYYYTSGYHPRFLERLAKDNDLSICFLEYWGSLKYMMHKIAGRFRTFKSLGIGIHDKSDLRFPSLIFVDGRVNENDLPLILKLQKYHYDLPPTTHIIDECWALLKLNK
jgi:SAM-dependent methyltransferase